MVADTDFHGAGFDGEVRRAFFRNRAGTQADPHAACIVDGNDLVQGAAHGSFSSTDLPHENLPGNAATFAQGIFWRRRHVVVGDYGLDLDAIIFGHFNGHLDVHIVTGVVAV